MALSIYTGLILFALVHLGIAYSIWGPESEQVATLDATLDILKSVNKNPETSNTYEESQFLARKLLTLFKQVDGMVMKIMDIVSDDQARHVAEVINILVYRSDNLRLQRAELEVYKNKGLYINDYIYFLSRKMLPYETKLFTREALELDNKRSFEHSQVMSDFFKIYLAKYKKGLTSYHDIFQTPADFFTELYKYNQRNEWNAFMIMTTAYKLRSLELNDNNYLKDFERLRKQLMEKLAMHEAKYDEALDLARAKSK